MRQFPALGNRIVRQGALLVPMTLAQPLHNTIPPYMSWGDPTRNTSTKNTNIAFLFQKRWNPNNCN